MLFKKFLVATNDSKILGFLAALLVFLPYTGKITRPIPALVLSYIFFIPFFMLTAKRFFDAKLSFSRKKSFFFIGILVFFLFILWAADREQYLYLLQWKRWPRYQTYYFESKLTAILLANLPALWCIATSLFLIPHKEDRRFILGTLLGIICCATLALVKLDLCLPALLFNSYEFFLHKTLSPTICITGFSPLFAAATLTLFTFLRAASTANQQQTLKYFLFVFLFILGCSAYLLHLFWIAQRFNFILCVILLFLLSALSLIRQKQTRPLAFFCCILLLVLPVGWISCGACPRDYWKALFLRPDLAAQERLKILSLYHETFPLTQDQALSSSFHSFIFGKGLGSFSLFHPTRKYPHNILLETLYEIGFLAFSLLFFYTSRVCQWGLSVLSKVHDPLLLSVALNTFIFLAHAFKSGDLTYLGVYFFMMTLSYKAYELSSNHQLAPINMESASCDKGRFI